MQPYYPRDHVEDDFLYRRSPRFIDPEKLVEHLDRMGLPPHKPITENEIYRPCEYCNRWTSTTGERPKCSSTQSGYGGLCYPNPPKGGKRICSRCNRHIHANERMRCAFHPYYGFCDPQTPVPAEPVEQCVLQ
jgi:hypothetical protein